MSTPAETLKFPAGAPGDSLKGLLSLLSNAKALTGAVQAPQPVHIGPELAYKLAQASIQASDQELLKTSILALLDALEGINMALSGGKS